MPQVGFEPTIPIFEQAKTVYTLDRAATVIGRFEPSTFEPNSLERYRYVNSLGVVRHNQAGNIG
jgi:hypothetical protein